MSAATAGFLKRRLRLCAFLLMRGLLAVVLLLGECQPALAQGADWPPLEISLTGEAADGVVTLRAELHNHAPYRLSDLSISGSLPDGAEFLGGELISSANPGRFDGTAVQFHLEHLNPATTVGPIVWRFRGEGLPETTGVHAWAEWMRPTPGTGVSPELNLATLSFLGRRPAADSAVAKRLDALLSRVEVPGTRVGILVYNPESGRIEYARDEDQAFVPASNAKLLVAAAALDAFGADYRFSTVIASNGELGSDGVLHGDVFVRGEGDPTLTTLTLDTWAEAWAKAGLIEVRGDLIVDDSYFGGDVALRPGWTDDDEREPFEPRVGALSVNQNQAALVIAPGSAPGEQVQVSKDPSTQQVKLYNLAITSPAGGSRSLSVVRDEENGRWEIRGKTPADGRPLRRQVIVDQPALYTGDVLRSVLEERGVGFASGSKLRLGAVPPSARILKTYRSDPLDRILSLMLKDSDNFVAEMVLYALGAHVSGTGGNGAGQAAVASFVKRTGLSMPFYLCDACGLSANNKVSPELVVGLLAAMRGHRDGKVLREGLATAAVDGTLADRMKGTPAAGRVQAKTGSLLVASTLSGYLVRSDGSEVVFSILMNCDSDGGWDRVQTMRDLQDRLVAALVDPG